MKFFHLMFCGIASDVLREMEFVVLMNFHLMLPGIWMGVWCNLPEPVQDEELGVVWGPPYFVHSL